MDGQGSELTNYIPNTNILIEFIDTSIAAKISISI